MKQEMSVKCRTKRFCCCCLWESLSSSRCLMGPSMWRGSINVTFPPLSFPRRGKLLLIRSREELDTYSSTTSLPFAFQSCCAQEAWVLIWLTCYKCHSDKSTCVGIPVMVQSCCDWRVYLSNSGVQFSKAYLPPDICYLLQNWHYQALKQHFGLPLILFPSWFRTQVRERGVLVIGHLQRPSFFLCRARNLQKEKSGIVESKQHREIWVSSRHMALVPELQYVIYEWDVQMLQFERLILAT